MHNSMQAETSSSLLGPLTINKFGEGYFYHLNRGSFDSVSAHALYDAQFADQLLKPHQLCIVIGTDSGLLPQYLQQKGIPQGTRYLFIEPEAILQALQAQGVFADLPDEISCCSMTDWQEQAITFKLADYFYISAVHSLNSLCAQEASFEEYPELSWLVTEKLSQFHWNFCMSLGNETFVIQQMNNLADNFLPAKLLKNAFKGQTAVILAGGPSLDEALPWVKQHREHLTVFAVSRIARQLIAHQLEPDFILSVDPTELSFDISKEMLTFSKQPIFVYAYHTIPSLVNQWPGKALYLGERLPWKTTLNQANIGSAGPTVTNTAISTAYEFGFKRLILAGVDLCFTRTGYTHAKGSDEERAGPRFNLTSLQIETNGGDMAPTSCDFLSATQSLANQALSLTQQGCQLINPAAQSAKIANIDYIPLSDIRLTTDQGDTLQAMHSRIADAAKDAAKDWLLLDQELQQAHYQISKIQTLAEQALKINEAMYNSSGMIENHKDKRQLDKIEHKLKRQYRQFSSVVKRFGIRQFIKIIRPFDDEALSSDEAKSLGHVYYTAYRDGAKALLGLIDDARDRLKARQEEAQAKPDMALLFKQWEKDRSYGRARAWLNQPDAVTAEDHNTLRHYVQTFNDIIANQDTRHLAQAKRYSSLATFKSRAKLLFKHGKSTELQDLKAGLAKHADAEAAQPYRHLATAYSAELTGDIDSALNAYQLVLDSGEKNLLEDALIRIADLSLQLEKYDNAYLALQCLAQLSPIHIPLYAEINHLMGESAAAIDHYCTYISQFPNDALIQLKLANLHLANQHPAAAEVVLDYILTNNPQHKAALELKSRTQALLALA